ncbi:MAG: hypothetical protein H0U74_07160 [Bradymonadaceae bacterium]|nr:hypothetical protein [Lujinxingiaceae bacterium]
MEIKGVVDGELGAAVAYTWTVDPTMPTVNIYQFPDPHQEPYIKFRCEGLNLPCTFECQLQASETVLSQGACNEGWIRYNNENLGSPLQGGDYTFQVRATNVLNVQSTPATHRWTLSR